MNKLMLNEQFRRMQKLAGLLTENEETPSILSELNLTDESNWDVLYGPGGRIFQISQKGSNIDRKNQIVLDIMVSERKNRVTIGGDPGNSAELVKTIDGMFNSGASKIRQFSNSGALETFITLDQLDQLAPGLYERDEETSGMMEAENLNEDKPTVGKMKDLIYQDYREIVDSGKVEYGTEEWLFLLQLALKVYGLDIQNEYDILKGIDGKGPYAKQIKALGNSWIQDLEIALDDLEVEAY